MRRSMNAKFLAWGVMGVLGGLLPALEFATKNALAQQCAGATNSSMQPAPGSGLATPSGAPPP